jgi:DNA-binding transcriptional MerR regulator
MPENSDDSLVMPADAARRLGISKATLIRYSDSGVIKAQLNEKGNRVYKESDLDDYLEKRTGAPDSQFALSVAQNELTTTALDHIRKTFELVHEPSLAVMSILKDENTALRNRNGELEKLTTDLIKAREQALNEQHARDIATKEAEASLKRKDDVMALLKTVAKPLSAQILASVGGTDKTKAVTAAMVNFLTKIDRDKIEVMLKLDFLDAEEKDALRELLKQVGVDDIETSAEEVA